MNRRDFLKSAAALAGAAALPVPTPAASSEIVLTGTDFSGGVQLLWPEQIDDLRGDYICSSMSGWSFRSHSEKPRVIDYVEPDRLIYRTRRGVNVPTWYEPEREYLGVL